MNQQQKINMLFNRMTGKQTYSNPIKQGFKRARLVKNSLYQGYMTTNKNAPTERKYFDVTATGKEMSTSISVVDLNKTAQGDDDINRDGRKITMKSFLFRAVLKTKVTTGVPQSVRVLIVYDKQSNGSALGATDVLEAGTIYSPLNIDNSKRFVILYDKLVDLGAGTGLANGNGGGAPSVTTIKLFKRLPNLEATYGATAAAVPLSGAIEFFTVGTEATGNTTSTMDYYSRIRFVG